MRVLAGFLALMVAAPLAAAPPAGDGDAKPPSASRANCPGTASYFADRAGLYQGQPLAPRKLTELPPAITYMAVYREIGGCEVPLTLVEYRNPRRH